MRPDGNPGWTDDRIARLTKLWIDGYSASQIAATLGWISRCAVIGKARRLGLPPKTPNAQTRLPSPRASILHLPLRPTRIGYGSRSRASKRPRFTPAEQPPSPSLAIVPRIVQELNIPAALRVHLLDLRECMCRWPIGDPKDSSFHFCGRQKEDGTSYCGHHGRIAFQPEAPRKSRRPGGFRLELRYA